MAFRAFSLRAVPTEVSDAEPASFLVAAHVLYGFVDTTSPPWSPIQEQIAIMYIGVTCMQTI